MLAIKLNEMLADDNDIYTIAQFAHWPEANDSAGKNSKKWINAK